MTKRKDGRWQESVVINGKRRYFYGKSKADVMRKISEFKDRDITGKLFSEVADEWWNEHSPEIEYNTKKAYTAPLKSAKELYGDIPTRSITAEEIKRYVTGLISKGYSRHTITQRLMVLKMILSYAVIHGYIDINPAREVFIPKKIKCGKRDIASDKDIEIIKQSYDVPFGDFAYWALYTGCRKGELLALTWDDVHLDDGYISVSKSIYHENGKPRVKSTKTQSGVRNVPILKALQDKIKPSKGYVFAGKDGKPMTEKSVRLRWDKYAKQTGVSCTVHQLRHAYATLLYESGIPVLDAQLLLGHANASTTQDIYTHIRNSRQENIRKKLYDADF